MLRDVMPLEEKRSARQVDSYIVRALTFFAQSLGIKLYVDRTEDVDVSSPIKNALLAAGIIQGMQYSQSAFADEPPTIAVTTFDAKKQNVSGGLATRNEDAASLAALGEALERHIWAHETDFADDIRMCTFEEMQGVRALDPLHFVGLTEEWRKGHERYNVLHTSPLTWCKAYSYTSQSEVYIPLQIVSKKHAVSIPQEPLIYTPITTGLATGPNKEFALHGGLLEIIERDAFMIMWLNQLSLPRIAPSTIATPNSDFSILLSRCSMYKLDVHFVYLVTDAPTHAIMAVVRDQIRHANPNPHTTIGLSAGSSLERVAEKALLEALRARRNARRRAHENPELMVKNPKDIKHVERGVYWCDPAREHELEFLYKGAVREAPKASWENDTVNEHLERNLSWARRAGYEVISTSLTSSRSNTTGWHVEFVSMPALQPMHQNEGVRYTSGKRLSEIPALYDIKTTPHNIDAPHPFV